MICKCRWMLALSVILVLVSSNLADDKEPSSDGKTATQWIEEFAKAESNVDKRRAVEKLTKMGKPAVPYLVKGLQTDSLDKKICCLAVINSLGPNAMDAVPAIVEVLKDKDVKLRGTAIQVLARMGPAAKAAVPAMIAQFKDKELRYLAGDALGRIGKDATPELLKVVNDKDESIREVTVYALMQVAERDGARAKEAIPALLAALKDKNPNIRQNAVAGVGWIGSDAKAAVPDLIEILKSANGILETQVMQSLGNIGSDAKPAIPMLVEKLRKAQGKSWIVMTLGKIGPDADAVAVLVPLLKVKESGLTTETARREHSEATATQVEAAIAIGKAGKAGKAAVPSLIEALSDKSILMREAAAKGLGEIGPDAKAAVPELIKMLKENDYRARNAASDALKKLDPGAAKKAGVR